MRKLYFLWTIAAIFILLASCNTSKMENDKSENIPEQTSVSKDRIVFLHLHIRLEDGVQKVQLNDQKFFDGILKNQQPFVRNKNHTLTADFKDASGHILFSIELDHPLNPTFEVPVEGQQMETQTLSLTEADFMIRYQNDKRISSVGISEKIKEQTTLLDSFNLSH